MLSIQTLSSMDALKAEQEDLEREMGILVEQIQSWVEENAHRAIDQTAYNKKYNGLVDQYNELKQKYDANAATIDQNLAAIRRLEEFSRALEKQGVMKEFDEVIWGALVSHMTVYSKDDIRVTFKDGTEIKVK